MKKGTHVRKSKKSKNSKKSKTNKTIRKRNTLCKKCKIKGG